MYISIHLYIYIMIYLYISMVVSIQAEGKRQYSRALASSLSLPVTSNGPKHTLARHATLDPHSAADPEPTSARIRAHGDNSDHEVLSSHDVAVDILDARITNSSSASSAGERSTGGALEDISDTESESERGSEIGSVVLPPFKASFGFGILNSSADTATNASRHFRNRSSTRFPSVGEAPGTTQVC